MTEQETIREAMSLLGKRTSAAKKRAARLNGSKGGRPRSKPRKKAA